MPLNQNSERQGAEKKARNGKTKPPEAISNAQESSGKKRSEEVQNYQTTRLELEQSKKNSAKSASEEAKLGSQNLTEKVQERKQAPDSKEIQKDSAREIQNTKDNFKRGSPDGSAKPNPTSTKVAPEEITKLQKNVPSPPLQLADNSTKDSIAKLAQGRSEAPPTSIAELAKQDNLIKLPWIPKSQPIPLGTLFHSRLCQTMDPWSKKSPFDSTFLESISAVYKNDDGGYASFQSLETNESNTSEEHLSVSFGITVGCSFLNASVTGGYDKDTLENNDERKLSIKASFRAGSILMEDKPQLSLDAMALLKHQGGLAEFKRTYGDYYVAGYRLGGDSAVMLSETSFAKSTVERLSVVVSVKVLFVKASVTHEKFFRSSASESGFRVSGFDTLEQIMIPSEEPVSVRCITPSGGSALEELASTANLMEKRCVKLAERVTERVEKLGLKAGQEIPWEKLESMLGGDVVVEIVLLPVSSLRQVQEWSLSKDVIGF